MCYDDDFLSMKMYRVSKLNNLTKYEVDRMSIAENHLNHFSVPLNTKFVGLRAKIWAKNEAVESKISKFSQKGALWTGTFAWQGKPCKLQARREKRSSV